MKFKHFPKSEVVGSGGYVFRHYGETAEKSRFVQFAEGTLEELTKDDFGSITTFNPALFGCAATYSALYAMATSSGLFTDDEFIQEKLKKITMPDTITGFTSVANVTDVYLFSFCKQVEKIKLSGGLTNYTAMAIIFMAAGNGVTSGRIADFTSCAKVPSITKNTLNFAATSDTGGDVWTIKVPSSLLSSWKTSWGSNVASDASIVGV